MIATTNKFNKYLPILLALCVSCNFVSFMPHLGDFLYIICGCVFMYGLAKGSGFMPDKVSMCFLFICILSILLNEIPAFIKPWQRFVIFCFVGFLVGCFIENTYLNRMRIALFFVMKWVFLSVSVLSGIGYFLGFSLMKSSNFVGYTGHSNILGGIAGIGLIFLLFLILYYSSEIKAYSKLRYGMWGLAFLSFAVILLTASRTALLACFGGCFTFFYLACSSQRVRIIKFSVLVAVVLAFSFPLWESYTEKLVYKNHGEVFTVNTRSREGLWSEGVNMFMRHPVIGVGFSNVMDDEYDGFTTVTGGFETGNSYLTVMMMTGILGFVPFVIICLGILLRAYSAYKSDSSNVTVLSFLIAELVFYFIHMVGEGYVMSAGNLFFFDFWLTLGCISAYCRRNSTERRLSPVSVCVVR